MNNKIFTGGLIVVLIAGVGFLLLPKNSSGPDQSTLEINQISQDKNDQSRDENLAGIKSSYVPFTKSAYEKAVGDGKIIFLDFYATWCPICRAEAPEIKAGFDSLTTDRIAGFRVNFNDEETDEEEKALAKQFNVPYQHTKIILKDGKEVLRSGDQWDKDTFLQEINKVLE